MGEQAEWVALFRQTYNMVSELVSEARHINVVLLGRMDILQDDVASVKGMLVDLRSDVAVQVTATESETARLQAALRGVEQMLERVSVRLATVTPLPVPAGGIAVVEELSHR